MAGERILMVDDDPDFVEGMRLLLEAHGYRIFQVTSGREALEKIDQIKPELIILDIMMESEIAGFEMAYHLRNPAAGAPYAAFFDVPILMLTGMGERKQMSFAPQTNVAFLPVDAYLEKPVDPDRLLNEIAALLQAVKRPLKPF